MNQKNIKEYIRALDHISNFLRTLLDEENLVIPEPRNKLSKLTDLRILSKSVEWPEAVPVDLICGETKEDKLLRATGIIQDFIQEDLEGKSFLDFGCGEGHVPLAATDYKPKISVGYDIEKDKAWDDFAKEKLILTKEWEAVRELSPFDVILVNDVLDHTKDPKEALLKIKEVKSKEGKVILRVHPWTSRHGTHLYKSLNKAYLHLVFTEEELYSMGLKSTSTMKVLDPEKFYKEIIKEAGFEIKSEQITIQPVELFFTQMQEVLRRIKLSWRNSESAELASGSIFPREIMEIQFIDFILV